MNEVAPLVLDLLNYIEQVEKLKTKPAFSVPTEFFSAGQQDLKGLPEVQFNVQDESGDIWLRVPRLHEIPPPPPDFSLNDWITLPKVPTRLIAFTGSKKVGLEIHERAAKSRPGQIWIKRTILEMGGKDSILVAADCDFDAAVEGVIASAFGFSGQKCSACSRAIVEAPIYDRFVKTIREKVVAINIGDPRENAFMGPVVSEAAMNGILRYIEIGKSEGRLIAGGNKVEMEGSGFFIEPTVFADLAPDARISLEEIFGPVLAILKANDFNHALEIANNTEYGLTGAVYSRDRRNFEDCRNRLHVGNLYFNRKCTGAMVGAHPFGGFNMSGTDSKAGGPDYLYLFTQAKSVAERLS